MSYSKLTLSLAIFLSLFGASPLTGASPLSHTYYISTAGSDGQTGGEASPWQHLQYGIDRAQPGDTLVVSGGTYPEAITINKPLTIRAAAGQTIVLDGAGLGKARGVTIAASDVTVEGFQIRNFEGFGVVMWDAYANLTLRRLDISAVRYACVKIGANGGPAARKNILIEDVRTHDYAEAGFDFGPGRVEDLVVRRAQLDGPESGNDTGSDGIAVENGDGVTIEDTYVFGHQGDGIDMKASNVTVRRVAVKRHGRNGMKVWAAPSLIEDCRIEAGRKGLAALVVGGAGEATLKRNVILNNGGDSGGMHAYSVEFGQYGADASSPLLYLTLQNNTFHTEGNGGVLISMYMNTRLRPESDGNTYFNSSRTDAVFGAFNLEGKHLWPVTPQMINDGTYARHVSGEAKARWAADVPASSAAATPDSSTQKVTSLAPPNPIDGAEFFVSQHYRDFLSREPEAEGFNAWVGVLNRCASAAIATTACDRVEVSASFFRSEEFQLKGYFAYRFYKVSLGRVPKYVELTLDMGNLSGPTNEEVSAKRAAFPAAWLNRPEFRAAFDGLSDAAFVDKLQQTAAVQLAARDRLIIALNNGTMTRAEVLRAVVESPEVFEKFHSEAFVVMQYFGYLKRDPEPEGLNAWLRVIEANPADYRTMVNGFVNSAEYRQRFGRP